MRCRRPRWTTSRWWRAAVTARRMTLEYVKYLAVLGREALHRVTGHASGRTSNTSEETCPNRRPTASDHDPLPGLRGLALSGRWRFSPSACRRRWCCRIATPGRRQDVGPLRAAGPRLDRRHQGRVPRAGAPPTGQALVACKAPGHARHHHPLRGAGRPLHHHQEGADDPALLRLVRLEDEDDLGGPVPPPPRPCATWSNRPGNARRKVARSGSSRKGPAPRWALSPTTSPASRRCTATSRSLAGPSRPTPEIHWPAHGFRRYPGTVVYEILPPIEASLEARALHQAELELRMEDGGRTPCFQASVRRN